MLLIIISAIAQIVIESLPISSSGHVALIACLYRYFVPNYDVCCISDEFMHALHIPTVCIIAFFFFSSWWFLLCNYRKTWRIIIKLIALTALIDLITALFFVAIRLHLCAFSIPLYIGFAITSLILFSLRWAVPKKDTQLNISNAIIIGAVQGIALLPGISRFAAVYSASSWLGFDWRKSFAITWMVQWPLIAAASAKSIIYFMQSGQLALLWTPQLGIAIMGASIFGVLGMYVVYHLARVGKLWWFSIYMIVPFTLAYWYCV